MTKDELINYITIIHEKELANMISGFETWSLQNIDGKNIIVYEHAQTLIDIYSNITEDFLKEDFIKNLEARIIVSEETSRIKNPEKYGREVPDFAYDYYSMSALSFYTLLTLGFVDKCIDSFEERLIYSYPANVICKLLIDLLSEDFNYLNINQITKLLTRLSYSASPQGYYYQSLKNILSENGYKIIKKEIKGVNIEINRDKESVIKKINILNFDSKYNLFLKELDDYINSGSSIVSSGMIGNFRSFMENLLTDLAKKIAVIKNEEIPKNSELSQMGNIRKYLKIQLELSDADNSLINKYIDVLHAEGGHSFTSNNEYFRLAKNIGIEIVLLLLTKFEIQFN